MGDPVRIRTARAADGDCLVRLWVELIDHHRALVPSLRHAAARPDRLQAEVDRGLRSADCRFFVAEVEEQVVGFLFVERETGASAGGGWLHEMYLQPDFRGRGAADTIVDAGIAWLGRRGAERVSVRVEAANSEAFGFWRRQGFEERAYVLERAV